MLHSKFGIFLNSVMCREGMNALDHSYSAQVNRLDIIRIGEALLDRMNRRSKCLLELARLKDLKGAFESCVQMIPRYSIEVASFCPTPT